MAIDAERMIDRPIAELIEALRAGDVRAVDLAEIAAIRQSRLEPLLNAYTSVTPDLAHAQAGLADAAFAQNVDLGPLQGLPLAIKDVFGIRGLPTFAGTKRRLGPEWEREGPIVSGLRNQLGVFTGKLHTVEFALGVIGSNPHWGTPRNPWDAHTHRVSGGSTSGGGVAIREGSAVLSLGSDAGGSIRIPAALTGCVGIRTSIGRFPTGGAPPLAPSLDTPGLIARSIPDLAIGCAAIDARLGPWPELLRTLASTTVAGLRLGVADPFYFEGCGPGVAEVVRAAIAELQAEGATLVDVAIPERAEADDLATVGGLTVPEVFACIKRLFAAWIPDIDRNVWSRLETYGGIDAETYLARQEAVAGLVARLNARLGDVDALLLPTTAITAPARDEVASLDDYRAHNVLMGRNTYLMNLADLPAITVPAGLDPRGLPVGLQICGCRMQERRLLAVAAAIERVLGDATARLGRPAAITGA